MSRKYHEGDEPVPGSGYRLLEFLGRGGFGEVWKASAPGGTEAALKIIQLGGTEGRKEFRALQLVKKIRHTHLVPMLSLANAFNDEEQESLVNWGYAICDAAMRRHVDETLHAPSAFPYPE